MPTVPSIKPGLTLVMQSAIQPEDVITRIRQSLVPEQPVDISLVDVHYTDVLSAISLFAGDGRKYGGWVNGLAFALWPVTAKGASRTRTLLIRGVVEPHGTGSRIVARSELSISLLVFGFIAVVVMAAIWLPDSEGIFITTVAVTLLAGFPLFLYGIEYFSMMSEHQSLKKFLEDLLGAVEIRENAGAGSCLSKQD